MFDHFTEENLKKIHAPRVAVDWMREVGLIGCHTNVIVNSTGDFMGLVGLVVQAYRDYLDLSLNYEPKVSLDANDDNDNLNLKITYNGIGSRKTVEHIYDDQERLLEYVSDDTRVRYGYADDYETMADSSGNSVIHKFRNDLLTCSYLNTGKNFDFHRNELGQVSSINVFRSVPGTSTRVPWKELVVEYKFFDDGMLSKVYLNGELALNLEQH